jgi:multidrug efflux pump subunit AcrA (membrane-fusion protein)
MNSPTLKKRPWEKFLIIPAIAIGIVIFMVLGKNQKVPQSIPSKEPIQSVRVIEVPMVNVIPRALAYGNVQPGTIWNAVAEVSGKIVEKHPKLKQGSLLKSGDLLLRIDPVDYKLAIAQSEANLKSIQAQLAELEIREKNTRLSLKIEQQVLKVAKKELARQRQLLKRKVVSTDALDKQERTVLAQTQQVQSLTNTLNLIPAERQVFNAQLAVAETQVESAKLNLKRTTITLPFDARIAQVKIEKNQFTQVGQVLVVADSIDVAEIYAQIAMPTARHLLQAASSPVELGDLPKAFGLSAIVRLHEGNFKVEWQGRFVRASEGLDSKTRTVGIVVAVDDSYHQAVPGVRPPLLKNMFVEVELRGKPHSNRLIIPRSALHSKQVYIVNSESRLEKRSIEIDFWQGHFVAIKKGLQKGEQVIVSDLIPAIEGMLLKPILDKKIIESLWHEAQGNSYIK